MSNGVRCFDYQCPGIDGIISRNPSKTVHSLPIEGCNDAPASSRVLRTPSSGVLICISRWPSIKLCNIDINISIKRARECKANLMNGLHRKNSASRFEVMDKPNS